MGGVGKNLQVNQRRCWKEFTGKSLRPNFGETYHSRLGVGKINGGMGGVGNGGMGGVGNGRSWKEFTDLELEEINGGMGGVGNGRSWEEFIDLEKINGGVGKNLNLELEKSTAEWEELGMGGVGNGRCWKEFTGKPLIRSTAEWEESGSWKEFTGKTLIRSTAAGWEDGRMRMGGWEEGRMWKELRPFGETYHSWKNQWVYEAPALKFTALRFTETLELGLRRLVPGGECSTFDQLALRAPLTQGIIRRRNSKGFRA
ncbi:hypothetical protein CCACVL1_26985 [Corchorus capsularis]|uniref:Large ribosomal subunit protein uL15/eL18 domain-containing protein n=1 Tax=Corchorus capsularis TaxID=210143 RepID=A0A1R3GCJ3_COCAP|nr:hypothetical protein CCACVL1_26985 [Corchorus capsularis]